ncbi:MAG: 9-O-acetylesterase [Planctomycetes bacterium]|nr:9-O-acetylesterase [Planctomycetota bacterium]
MPSPCTRRQFAAILLILTCSTGGVAVAAEALTLRLPRLLSDHAVLQQGKPIPVWGWAAPGAVVAATLGGATRTATAAADGRWKTTFDALKPGEPLTLTVVAGAETVSASDLLVGEVWVCSGQSNMEYGLGGVIDGEQEVAGATMPGIRLLHVGTPPVAEPLDDVDKPWSVCSPDAVRGFSAVGYCFGRELHREVGVPVGLIEAAWGGTPAESWTSLEAFRADPALAHFAQFVGESMKTYPAKLAEYEAAVAATKTAAIAAALDDALWHQRELDLADWQEMALPVQWENAGLSIDGVVWFRRTVEVPASAAGKDLELSLGPIDDQDTTWWDGEQIGTTSVWNKPRHYTIPANLVTAGPHVLAIKVVDTGGGGGLFGEPAAMTLTPAAGEPISLAGPWRYRVALEQIAPPQPPMGPGNAWFPSSLRYGRIAPLTQYAIRGAIWYQGESNAGRAWQYRTLFPAMIADWRAAWGQGDFPFYFVQLASFFPSHPEPRENDWAELRDAQFHTLRTVANTGMASAIDLGDAGDIHPRNKQDVGKRLALWALVQVHGKQVECSGPLYRECAVEAGHLRVRFDHLGGGLVAKGGPLARFAVAGEDRIFIWADAVIDGDTVLVSSARVLKPVAVRYAWDANPEGCNLSNQTGLPASPFRSDDWPVSTVNNK